VDCSDLDGDGSPDLAVGCWGGSDHTSSVISILLGHEGATFGKAGDFAVAPGPETIEAADFDGDGRADLLAPANFSPVATILLNRADRTISWDGTLPNGHAAISDLDGDGRKDLVLAGSVGSDHAYSALLNIYLNTTGTDLNGDGVLDDCAQDGVPPGRRRRQWTT
jgi:hypothetical protein